MRTRNAKKIHLGSRDSGNNRTEPSDCSSSSQSTLHGHSSSTRGKSKRTGTAARGLAGNTSWRSQFLSGLRPVLLPLFLCCMHTLQCNSVAAALVAGAAGGRCGKAAAFLHPTGRLVCALSTAAAASDQETGAAPRAGEPASPPEDTPATAAADAHHSRAAAAGAVHRAAAASPAVKRAQAAAVPRGPATAATTASLTATAAPETARDAVVDDRTRASAARTTRAAAADHHGSKRKPSARPAGSRNEAAARTEAATSSPIASEQPLRTLLAAAAAALVTWPAAAVAVYAAAKQRGGAARHVTAALSAAALRAATLSAAATACFLQVAPAAASPSATAAASPSSSYPPPSTRSPFLHFLFSPPPLVSSLSSKWQTARASAAGAAPAVAGASHPSAPPVGSAAAAAAPVVGGGSVSPPYPRPFYAPESSSPADSASSLASFFSSAPPPSSSSALSSSSSSATSPSPAAAARRPGAVSPAAAAAPPRPRSGKLAAAPGALFFSRLTAPSLRQRLGRQTAAQQRSSSRADVSALPLPSPPPVAARATPEDKSSRSYTSTVGKGNENSRSSSTRTDKTEEEEETGEPAGLGEPLSLTAPPGKTVEARAEVAETAAADEPLLAQKLLSHTLSLQARQQQQRQKEDTQQQHQREDPQEQELQGRQRRQQQRLERLQQEQEEEKDRDSSIDVPLLATMAWRCTGRSNDELVDRLHQAGVINNPRVYEAMKAFIIAHENAVFSISTDCLSFESIRKLLVDRGNFVASCAYMDSPQPLGIGSATISAPHMHALALEELIDHMKPGNRVLDVGSGSGYLTVVMAYIVGVKGIKEEKAAASQESEPEGMAVGIDYVPGLVKYSQDHVKKAYPRLLSNPHFRLVERDGWEGYPAAAPYDAIHVGAAAAAIPRRLLQQLKNGGKMVLPVEESLHGEILFEEEEGQKAGTEEKGVPPSVGRSRSAAESSQEGQRRRSGGGEGGDEGDEERELRSSSSLWRRLLMGTGGQRFVAVTKDLQGNVHVKKLMGVMYVPLVKRKESLTAKSTE